MQLTARQPPQLAALRARPRRPLLLAAAARPRLGARRGAGRRPASRRGLQVPRAEQAEGVPEAVLADLADTVPELKALGESLAAAGIRCARRRRGPAAPACVDCRLWGRSARLRGADH